MKDLEILEKLQPIFLRSLLVKLMATYALIHKKFKLIFGASLFYKSENI